MTVPTARRQRDWVARTPPSNISTVLVPKAALLGEWVTCMMVVPLRFNSWNSSMISRACAEWRLPVGSSA